MDITPTWSTQSMVSATENPEIVKLHPSGDALIVILDSNSKAHGRFLISSATLCLVSPYFRTLFGPNFKEGSDVLQGKCPEISLEEDEPKAMEGLLSILHFHDLGCYQSMEPRAIALLAQQSDKYDCGRALIPWAGFWFKGVGKLTKPEDYGCLLTAAYLLDLPEWFTIISATAVRYMPGDFLVAWSKEKITDRLPWDIKKAVEKQLLTTLAQVQQKVFAVERTLRNNTFYVISGRHNYSYCGNEVRVADYFLALRECGLWPSMTDFPACSVSDINIHLQKAKSFNGHDCAAKENCIFRRELQLLPQHIDTIMGRINGVSIPPRISNRGI
ncbi:hypothetical protein CKAH01_11034 [Colletotrichum kahawae]|uniref:BTB domain-containing protein n=1 Tax=Colletotrichum kahawae TaxID=34407 RepID=A0AAD9XVW4_COLKA|nr:hypothetical protein CKAH01_11034 [Colletotrichum kahawae]